MLRVFPPLEKKARLSKATCAQHGHFRPRRGASRRSRPRRPRSRGHSVSLNHTKFWVTPLELTGVGSLTTSRHTTRTRRLSQRRHRRTPPWSLGSHRSRNPPSLPPRPSPRARRKRRARPRRRSRVSFSRAKAARGLVCSGDSARRKSPPDIYLAATWGSDRTQAAEPTAPKNEQPLLKDEDMLNVVRLSQDTPRLCLPPWETRATRRTCLARLVLT